MKYLFFVVALLISQTNFAQDSKPVDWSFEVEKGDDGEYTLLISAKIKDNWAVYSQHTGEGGPVPLSFTYEVDDTLIGETVELSEPTKKFSDLFEVEVVKFKKEANFSQKFKPKKGVKTIKGYLTYMACDEEKCLPPTDVEFDISL